MCNAENGTQWLAGINIQLPASGSHKDKQFYLWRILKFKRSGRGSTKIPLVLFGLGLPINVAHILLQEKVAHQVNKTNLDIEQ